MENVETKCDQFPHCRLPKDHDGLHQVVARIYDIGKENVEMEELNKKIAKWCGWSCMVHIAHPDCNGHWHFGGDFDNIPPDFTTSLDACFEYIVPKLETIGSICFNRTYNGGWQADLGHACFFANAETPAIALCRAMEKLIDGECKHNFANVVNKAIPEPGLDVCTKCGRLGDGE